MSDFKGRHFGGEIVLWAVRWYCRYPISYRDLETMMTERGGRSRPLDDLSLGSAFRPGNGEAPALAVALATVAELAHRRDLRQGPRQVGVSVPCARQVREHARFLPLIDPQHQGREAIPRQGAERVEGLGAARGAEHRQGADVRRRHIAELKAEGKCPNETRHRQVKYLNNVVEADHGKLKLLLRPVRGFKTLKTAYATIKGFEVMRALRKGQAGIFALQDGIVGEARIVERAFGVGPCALTEVMALLQNRPANAEA